MKTTFSFNIITFQFHSIIFSWRIKINIYSFKFIVYKKIEVIIQKNTSILITILCHISSDWFYYLFCFY